MNNLISSYPTASFVTASRALVEALLKMNTRNRKVKEREIIEMTKDMQAGRFLPTGSGVSVSSCGVLLDGQNRLLAMRRAGYPPVKFVLATGLSLDSQLVIDRGAKRTLADSLQMYMNITISTRMVALARALHEHSATVSKDASFGLSRPLSDSEVAIFLSGNSDLTFTVLAESGAVRTSVAAALYVYAYHEKDKALEFCRQVCKGANLEESAPAFRLRNSIEKMRNANTASARLELFRLTVSAICAHSRGEKLKILKGSDSWSNANFKWCIPNVWGGAA